MNHLWSLDRSTLLQISSPVDLSICLEPSTWLVLITPQIPWVRVEVVEAGIPQGVRGEMQGSWLLTEPEIWVWPCDWPVKPNAYCHWSFEFEIQ